METMKADRDFWDNYHKLEKQGFEECPPEKQKTQVIECGGFKFKIWYNYVAPGRMGMTPINHWWINLIECPGWQFRMPLCEEYNDARIEDIAQDEKILSTLVVRASGLKEQMKAKETVAIESD